MALACLWVGGSAARADDHKDPNAKTQTTGGSDPNASNQDAIETMVITARKREENIQETPIAVTAFSSEFIQDNGLKRSDDIGNLVPNLQFDGSTNQGTSARITMRGIGNPDPILTRDPGVGIYVDGVYYARAQGQLFGLQDVERIEVLRGPQGTLFGRNTVGGAVHVITKKPSDQFETTGTVRVGNYNLIETEGSINIPLGSTEKYATRFSFQTAGRDGYTKNLTTGQETDDRKLLSGRGAFRASFTDSLELMVNGEMSRSHQAGRGGECRFVANALSTAALVQGEIGGAGIPVPALCAKSEGGNALTYFSPEKTHENLDTWGLGSTLTWNLGETTFKSITSWRREQTDFRGDFTYSPQNLATLELNTDRQTQISQEFNLGGKALDQRLNWTLGLFGMQEAGLPGPIEVRVGFNLCQLGVPGVCGASVFAKQSMWTTAYAAYGQATYDITNQLHFTAGLRRSLERKRYRHDEIPFTTGSQLPDGTRFVTDQVQRFGAWTPLFNLSYDVTNTVMTYATYTRGFKSGGFNSRQSSDPVLGSTLQPFRQETLDNYEVGMKSTWLDGKLLANASLFHGGYNDIQITTLGVDAATGAFSSSVINAAKAIVRGAELELRAAPTSALDLNMSFGVTDAHYTKFIDTVVIADPADVIPGPPIGLINAPLNRKNNSFIGVPTYTANFGGSYSLPNVPVLGEPTIRLNWHVQNGVNYGPYGPFGQSKRLAQGKVGLFSGRISFALPDGKTTLSLFGDNLFDRRYINSGINTEDGFATDIALYAPPRMFGFEVRRSFQ